MAVEALPSRFITGWFAAPIAPELTHRERPWPGSAVKKMLCGIVKNNLRRIYDR
jgi:hypothetical protein